MNIKTKYEIGQRIWVVYENEKGGTVEVYDDVIAWIIYDDEGLKYGLKECCEDLSETSITLYEETDKLVKKIKQLMQEIREKEGTNID